MYERKTMDRWDVETDWGYGWEAEYSSYKREDARARYREYRDNACGRFLVRLTKHRERKEVAV